MVVEERKKRDWGVNTEDDHPLLTVSCREVEWVLLLSTLVQRTFKTDKA